MKKIILSLVLIALLALTITPPVMALESRPAPQEPEGISVPGTISSIIKWTMGIFLVFAAFMFIWAGFLFATAQGDPEKIKTARNFVLWGVVGVIVAVLSLALVEFARTNLVL